MGHSNSRSSAGAGLLGVGAADDLLALDCSEPAQVAGLPYGRAGTGVLMVMSDELVVVSGETIIVTCEPSDKSTIRLRKCISMEFAFSAIVSVRKDGQTVIDVAPA